MLDTKRGAEAHLPTELLLQCCEYLTAIDLRALLCAIPWLADLLTDNHTARKDEQGRSILHLLASGVEEDTKLPDPIEGIKASKWPAKCNDRAAVMKLLFSRPEIGIDSEDDQGLTPLMIAAAFGHQLAVEALLQRADVDINAKSSEDAITALWYAATYGHESIVGILLKQRDIEVNSKGSGGSTPLHSAARLGREATVKKLLLRKDIDINMTDDAGFTPLVGSTLDGQLAAVQLLLSRKDVDINTTTNDDESALHIAARYGDHAIAQMLYEKGGAEMYQDHNNNNFRDTPLFHAVRRDDLDMMRILLSHRDEQDDGPYRDGRTFLMHMIMYGSDEAIKLALQRDIDINRQDESGYTALSLAVQCQRQPAIKMLLDHRKGSEPLKVDVPDITGLPPMAYAVRNEDDELVALLLENGAEEWHEPPPPPPGEEGAEGEQGPETQTNGTNDTG